jgi:hypothetical protein
MKRSITLSVFFGTLILTGCEQNSPVMSDPVVITTNPVQPTPMPTFHNDLISFLANPPVGSTLRSGDSFSVEVTGEVADAAFFTGLAYVRDDGKEYIRTTLGGAQKPGEFWFKISMTVNSRNSFYKFSQGHTINGVLIIGNSPLMAIDGIVWDNVVYSERVPLNYHVE